MSFKLVEYKKTITLTTMGESALRSHMAGNKHQVNVKSNGTASPMKPFLQRKDSDNQKNICAATKSGERFIAQNAIVFRDMYLRLSNYLPAT